MKELTKRIPIARCPVPDCGRTLMYSGDPKDKHTVMLSIASDGYQGKTMMCPKCKAVLKVIEKPKVAAGYISLPIISCIEC
jgi:hypothetical protein